MKKAFTLMEVLIVISIISVLIGIAVPRIKGFQEQAKKQKAQSGLKILQNAVEAYYMRHNAYPPQTDTLSADYLMGEESPKIDEVLYDPFGDGTQEYNYLVDGDYWAVSSRGSDRVRNVPVFSSNRLLIAAGVDDLSQTNGIVATCAEGGYTDCGGSCADLQTDEANCGSCGNACSEGQICTGGSCPVSVYVRTDRDFKFFVCIDGVRRDITTSYEKIGDVAPGGSVQFWAASDGNFYINNISVASGDGTLSYGGNFEGMYDPCGEHDGSFTVTSTGGADIYVFADLYYDD